VQWEQIKELRKQLEEATKIPEGVKEAIALLEASYGDEASFVQTIERTGTGKAAKLALLAHLHAIYKIINTVRAQHNVIEAVKKLAGPPCWEGNSPKPEETWEDHCGCIGCKLGWILHREKMERVRDESQGKR
jgi:hypothetical protein